MPSTNSQDEKEKQLGVFRSTTQTVQKNGKFKVTLTKSQLEYLYNSEYESLREIYNNIMEKAYQINNQEYINIDNELKEISMKGKVA